MLQPPFDVVFDMHRSANPVALENLDGSPITTMGGIHNPPFSHWDGKVYKLNVHYPGLCIAHAEADGYSTTDIVGFGLALADGSQFLCLCSLGSAQRAPGGHGSPGLVSWFVSKLRARKQAKTKRSSSAEVRACLGQAAAIIERDFLTQDPEVTTRAKLKGLLQAVSGQLTSLDSVQEEADDGGRTGGGAVI